MVTEKRIAGIEEAIDTIEMLIESLKSEMAILKEKVESPKDSKFEEARLSMLQETIMFNMNTLIKEHAKLVKSIKDLEGEVQTLTVDYLELKDMVEALEKKIVQEK